MKKSVKILLSCVVSVAFVVVLLFVLWNTAINPHRGVLKQYETSCDLDVILSKKEASTDYKYFKKYLTGRHPLWVEGKSELRTTIDNELKKAKEEIDNVEEIKVIDLWRIYSRILALLHDGHTSVFWNNNNQKFIHDFTQVMKYGRPTYIDGIKTETVFETFKTLMPWETEESVENRFFSTYFLSEHYERLCGINTQDGVTFTFNIEGKPTDFHYDFVEGSQIIYPSAEELESSVATNDASSNEAIAETGINDEFQTHADEVINEMYNARNDKTVFYKIDEQYNLGLLVLTSCDYDEYYCSTIKNFFDEVINGNISNVVVDLRGNGGGSSLVADEFIKYLNVDEFKSFDNAIRYGNFLWRNKNVVIKNPSVEKRYTGKVFVLTDVSTYSSAMDFAMFISDNKLGTIIGEASGNKPESYGDRLDFMLPKSKLVQTVSFKKWYRVDSSKADQLIEPDYPCEPQKALAKLYSML